MMGLLVGIVFGFLLRKGHVTRFSVIVGQLLMKDFTVMKVMLSAVAFGSVGIYGLKFFWADLPMSINASSFAGALAGGGLFGMGMAVLGYCPGTGIGALANGAKDMWSGLAGMVVGAGIFAELAAWLRPAEGLTKVTLVELWGVSPWVFVAGLLVLVGGMKKARWQ